MINNQTSISKSYIIIYQIHPYTISDHHIPLISMALSGVSRPRNASSLRVLDELSHACQDPEPPGPSHCRRLSAPRLLRLKRKLSAKRWAIAKHIKELIQK